MTDVTQESGTIKGAIAMPSYSYREGVVDTSFLVWFMEVRKMNIYIGNLSPEATVDDLRHAFEGFGQVASATIITDRMTGRSRGFAFVDMPNKREARAAISQLNGQELKGRRIIVNEARPRRERV